MRSSPTLDRSRSSLPLYLVAVKAAELDVMGANRHRLEGLLLRRGQAYRFADEAGAAIASVEGLR
jgi:hypothetical protein